MKFGLLGAEPYSPQGVAFAAQHKTALMGGKTSYPSYQIGFPPDGRYTPAMNHARQGFSLPPLDQSRYQGDRVEFSGKQGPYMPRY